MTWHGGGISLDHEGARRYLLDSQGNDKSFMLFRFPSQKAEIAGLTHEEKMEWYAYQFKRYPGQYPIELTTSEFASFWKWRVLIPMKIRRFLYRVKNFEVFKRYPHISEMRPKAKKHGI